MWQWLCNDYYSTKPDDNPETRQYLEKAKDHLVHHDSSGGHFVPMYPRVKMLLGDPIDEVESEFKDRLQHVTDFPKVILCQHMEDSWNALEEKMKAFNNAWLPSEQTMPLKGVHTNRGLPSMF